jgi:cytochrome c oxidase accessory protein FixG
MQHDTESQPALYQKRIPIFTRSVKGPFRRFKTAVFAFAFAVYFLLPWLPWARPDAPAQAVLFDLPGRRFLIFGLTVYPQDVIWLALLLFIAAIVLFLATALVGRAFCGYFCFQTLWTDCFIWIEHFVQGERPARQRLNRQAWDREKILKVGGTHALWVLVSFWTAMTFAAYFTYAPQLVADFVTGQAAPAAYITVGILTVSTYLAAALMREQVCTYVCPYGRFQSVMYEPQTLAVHYDARRGEGTHGRAAARAGQRTLEERRAQGIGDCVNCSLCVQVCPAGIDIRDGLQYKCIACGLCIDACNGIMDSFSFPRGLIRYDSEGNLATAAPAKPRLHWKRLSVIGYGVALVLMTGLLAWSIATRGSYDVVVSQVRQPLFVVLSNGDIRNRYQIRITHKGDGTETFTIGVRGLPEGAVDLGNFREIAVRSGHSGVVQASVRLDPALAARTPRVEFIITPRARPDETRSVGAHFDVPRGRP